MNLGISSKEIHLTGLHQNKNFGQVAIEFYLAEALWNLPEFGSEQTMKFESTFWNTTSRIKSSNAGELISQCGDPLLIHSKSTVLSTN